MYEREDNHEHLPHTQSVFRVSEVPEVYTSHQTKEVTLFLGGLKGIVPPYMQEQIYLHTEALAGLARFGGLERVGINIVDEKDQTSLAISSATSGGEATATHVAVAKAEVALTDLAPFEEEKIPHPARWGQGTITINKQDLDDLLRTHGARNAEAVSAFINKKMYQGILELGQKNLHRMTPLDWKAFLAFQAAIVGWTVAPLPLYYFLVATNSPLLHSISPVTLQEEVTRWGTTELIWSVVGGLTARRTRRRVYRLSEGGGIDPEFVRRGMIFTLRQAARFEQFREKYPVAWSSPLSENFSTDTLSE